MALLVNPEALDASTKLQMVLLADVEKAGNLNP